MTTIEPKTIPTFRTLHAHEPDKYERLAHLIKKYGCPVTKVSDGFDWIRVYFEIPKEAKEQFEKELS